MMEFGREFMQCASAPCDGMVPEWVGMGEHAREGWRPAPTAVLQLDAALDKLGTPSPGCTPVQDGCQRKGHSRDVAACW